MDPHSSDAVATFLTAFALRILEDLVFINNRPWVFDSAIVSISSSDNTVLDNCTFVGNYNQIGFTVAASNTDKLVLSNCRFVRDQLVALNKGRLIVRGSSFIDSGGCC